MQTQQGRDRSSQQGTESQSAPPSGRLWRRVFPICSSIVLLSWLIYRVPFGQVFAAAREINWPIVVPLTLSAVVVLYLWDAQCVRWVFAQAVGAVGYETALRARGSSYLVGAVNYSLGQGVLAWLLSRALRIPMVASLGRLLLIAYHDLWLLLTLGLIGSLTQSDLRLSGIRIFCGIGLVILACLTGAAFLFPGAWRNRLRGTRLAHWWEGWSWTRSLCLFAMRLINFGVSTVYAGIGLSLIHVAWSSSDLLRSISLIQLAEALPITMSGLGTRETILLGVMNPDHPERVLAFGLLWSAGLIVGRLAIGLLVLLSRRTAASNRPNLAQDTLATSSSSASMEPLRS